MKERRFKGFTLVEIMIVVVLIGILAGLAIPAFARVQGKTLATAAANDLRVFSEAFNRFEMDRGRFPQGIFGMNNVSDEMEPYLRGTGFDEAGDYNQFYFYFGLRLFERGKRIDNSIILFKRTGANRLGFYSLEELDLFDEVDRILDDGDLTTGEFRLYFNRYPMLVLKSS